MYKGFICPQCLKEQIEKQNKKNLNKNGKRKYERTGKYKKRT